MGLDPTVGKRCSKYLGLGGVVLPLGATGVGAGGAFLTGFSEGSRLGAQAAAAHAAAPAAAHLAVVGHARRRRRGTVAVVADEVGVALALAAVALAVTWRGGGRGGRSEMAICLVQKLLKIQLLLSEL